MFIDPATANNRLSRSRSAGSLHETRLVDRYVEFIQQEMANHSLSPIPATARLVESVIGQFGEHQTHQHVQTLLAAMCLIVNAQADNLADAKRRRKPPAR